MRLLPPLHHPGAEAETDATPLQRFLDSEAGIVLAGVLHTLGALLFTAGIALYLYQARQVRHAQQRNETPSLRVLPLAHGLTLGGILLNGIGGLMRLFESDHPSLGELATSSWVQLLFVKHLFLILGVALAVFLTYHTHWLATREDAPKSFFPHANRISAVAITSFGTILLATVLGAMAGNALLPPALLPGDGMEGGDNHTAHAGTLILYANRTGTITGSPAQPGRDESQWTLPANTTQIFVELGWTASPQVQMDVQLLDPQGKTASPKRDARSGRVSLTLDTPSPGTWKIVVTSEQAVLEPYTVIARATVGPMATIFERTYTVNPNPSGAARAFVEVNLKMSPGQRINFTWRVLDSPAKLDFNLHVHFSGNVEYPIRGSWNSYSGNYTHVTGKGDGASLMWTNSENPTPLRITCRIEGTFRFESEVIR